MKEICVIKVIDDFTLVLNVGQRDGIRNNQRFMIYGIDSEELFDPVTNESLGFAEYSKGYGRVNALTEKNCTIVSDRTQKTTRKERIGDYSYSSLPQSFFHSTSPKVIEYDENEPKPFDSPSIGDKAKIVN